MSPNPPWSTSSCCGNEIDGPRFVSPRAVLMVFAAAASLLLSRVAPAAAMTWHPPSLATLASPAGERDVETQDLRFVYYKTIYRHRHAPREEEPSGERVEVVGEREECRCIRFADWSTIKLKKIREIAITHAPGDRVAVVRVTRLNGKMNEYPATSLYGGEGLYPPLFSATIEGTRREFPLVLEGRPGVTWPEETLVRVLLTKPTPPPAKERHAH